MYSLSGRYGRVFPSSASVALASTAAAAAVESAAWSSEGNLTTNVPSARFPLSVALPEGCELQL